VTLRGVCISLFVVILQVSPIVCSLVCSGVCCGFVSLIVCIDGLFGVSGCVNSVCIISVCVDVDLVKLSDSANGVGALEREVFVCVCLSEKEMSGVLTESLFGLHLQVVEFESAELLSILREEALSESVRVQPLELHISEVLSIE